MTSSDDQNVKGCKPRASPRPTSPPVPRFLVTDLIRGGREVILVHDGQEYRLRITSNGKLILTK